MKYLAVTERCFIDKPGGSARVSWDIARLMRDSGHDVTLLCQRQPGSSEAVGFSKLEGMRILRYEKPALPAWHPKRLASIIESTSAVARRYLTSDQWDVVHSHNPLMARGLMKAFGPTVRYVYTAHSPVVLEQKINWSQAGWVGKLKLLAGLPVLRKIEKAVLKDSGGIHVLSKFTRDRLVEFHGKLNHVTVIPHWITENTTAHLSRTEARQKLGWPLDKKIFFSVRQLRHRYGLDVSIRSLAGLTNKNNVAYFIAGQGALRQSLERLAQDCGVSQNVWLLGRISDEHLTLAYQAADVFLLPTRALECFGLIILEALAHGCPVIASDAGAIPEVLEPVLKNSIVPADDTSRLTQKIESIVSGQSIFPDRETIRTSARALYGANVVVPRLLELLEGRQNLDRSDAHAA